MEFVMKKEDLTLGDIVSIEILQCFFEKKEEHQEYTVWLDTEYLYYIEKLEENKYKVMGMGLKEYPEMLKLQQNQI